MKLSHIVPAWFIGSPVALVAGSALHFVMPVGLALAVGAAAGFALGLLIMKNI